MITRQIKKYGQSVLIVLAVLCLVVSLCFCGSPLPEENVILDEFLSPTHTQIQRDKIPFQSNTKYRITSYYESRGSRNVQPRLTLKIEQSDLTVIDEHFDTNSGNGDRQGQFCWGHNNYGCFSVPCSGDFKLTINADSYPKEFFILKILISESTSRLRRHSLIAAGLMLFLIPMYRKYGILRFKQYFVKGSQRISWNKNWRIAVHEVSQDTLRLSSVHGTAAGP
jgi:hypothetical protein